MSRIHIECIKRFFGAPCCDVPVFETLCTEKRAEPLTLEWCRAWAHRYGYTIVQADTELLFAGSVVLWVNPTQRMGRNIDSAWITFTEV